MLFETHWPVRVYYEDTDIYGIVYYANYLKYLERGRTEHMRRAGFDQNRVRAELELIFPVRKVDIDFLAPAVFDDELMVESRVVGISGARFEFLQQILRPQNGNTDPDLICRAQVIVACINATTFKPARLPEDIYTALETGNGS
mgnify:CR=1 FL=1